MSSTRALLVVGLVLVLVPVTVGCSHDEEHHAHQAQAVRTSGDDRVETHEGMDDTVATQDSARTAMDQGESESDLEITRQIRAAVTSDSSLSFGARNCVIITNGGHVTLRGDATSAESASIERHAVQVAGILHVENDIHITDRAAAP